MSAELQTLTRERQRFNMRARTDRLFTDLQGPGRKRVITGLVKAIKANRAMFRGIAENVS